ncbi:phosphoenolpyruvate--protein phosphotransferase [Acidocella sp.]|uniref:phosphoenolpyruvate--protein phosphotransferase n=1 Tax=Acidocella sp. TaxID=50710 RepID=UPI00261F777B|nr:phosphoenolpyruvate--protein phosphotransferase [Acidocella sp.]
MKAIKGREQRFTGHPVSPGIGIGPVHEATEPPLAITARALDEDDIAPELERLDEALTRSRHQLQKLKNRLAQLPEDSQAEIAPLMDVYLHMLGPSRLLRGVRARIETSRLCAEAAMQAEAETQAEAILALPGPDRAGKQRRADEVRELARRVVRNLTRQPFRSFASLPQGAVLAAESLRPADAALIQPAQIAGVITAEGGIEGHSAVMLRALGLPAVLGAAGVLEAAAPGALAILDGDSGEIILNPTRASLDTARARLAEQAKARRALSRLSRLPAETRDGTHVELQANLELPFELAMIARSGAHGIGLLRSEFMFMNRPEAPDEDTQTRIYRDIVEAMDGDPVTIRVLDWGSDKEVEALSQYLPATPETNPALGLRGIRLLLRHPHLLETQLAAILRAAAFGPVRIMLPMVSVAAEITETREILKKLWRRLKRRGGIALPDELPPLGIMVETPAAALAAPVLARHADFFAIGTNDLTMYTLAADRGMPLSAQLYDPLEPAVLRLIHMTASFAGTAGIPVSLCGELASRPRVSALLLGLGVRQFSMHGNAIPRVKQAIRATTLPACQALAERALGAESAEQVRALLEGE